MTVLLQTAGAAGCGRGWDSELAGGEEGRGEGTRERAQVKRTKTLLLKDDVKVKVPTLLFFFFTRLFAVPPVCKELWRASALPCHKAGLPAERAGAAGGRPWEPFHRWASGPQGAPFYHAAIPLGSSKTTKFCLSSFCLLARARHSAVGPSVLRKASLQVEALGFQRFSRERPEHPAAQRPPSGWPPALLRPPAGGAWNWQLTTHARGWMKAAEQTSFSSHQPPHKHVLWFLNPGLCSKHQRSAPQPQHLSFFFDKELPSLNLDRRLYS